jgi:hypothetical protein
LRIWKGKDERVNLCSFVFYLSSQSYHTLNEKQVITRNGVQENPP